MINQLFSSTIKKLYKQRKYFIFSQVSKYVVAIIMEEKKKKNYIFFKAQFKSLIISSGNLINIEEDEEK